VVLFALFIGAVSAMGRSVEGPRDAAWISTILVSPARCNRGIATKVEFTDLVRSPGLWEGKCVAVNGYWKRRTLFVSKTAAEKQDGQSIQDQLGLYGRDALLSAAPKHPLSYSAVGVVGDCKHLWDATPMVLGYCHYYAKGPYLALGEMRRR
jgi:hypothetical protein